MLCDALLFVLLAIAIATRSSSLNDTSYNSLLSRRVALLLTRLSVAPTVVLVFAFFLSLQYHNCLTMSIDTMTTIDRSKLLDYPTWL